MFQLQDTLVSEDLIDYDFVCNLNACKGACCIDGDAGAPVEDDETAILERIFPQVRPFLTPEGIEAIEAQGTWVIGSDGEKETPLVGGAACAYVVVGPNGITHCGIEAAYNAGAVDWRKPVSCHLYPVRTRTYETFTAVNYHQWQICTPACTLGQSLQVPVYQFVKDALVRKFGQAWYDELCLVAEEHKKQQP
jgi:hypothetical protein